MLRDSRITVDRGKETEGGCVEIEGRRDLEGIVLSE